jgi:heptosyltransferase-2
MAQPSVCGFAEMLSDSHIFLLMPDWAEPIFGGIPNAEPLLLHRESLHGLKGIAAQLQKLKKRTFETGILLTPSFSSALVFSLAGVKNRFGYISDRRGFLLNNPVAGTADLLRHRSESFQQLLEIAAAWRFNTARSTFDIKPADVERADNTLRDNGIILAGKFIAISPQAVAESRRWGADNYRILAEKLIHKYDISIVLIGTSEEISAGDNVAGENEKIVNLCGKTDVELAAAVLSKARLFVGNDSGLAHLAGAVDIPLVVISGPDNPRETSPLSDKKTVIIRDELECISCVKNVCPKTGDDFMRCMNEISPDDVFKAVSQYL